MDKLHSFEADPRAVTRSYATRFDSLPPLESLTGCTQLNPSQAACYLYKTEQTLAVWRCTKRYPLPYLKIGKAIRYRVSDLRTFIETNIKTGV